MTTDRLLFACPRYKNQPFACSLLSGGFVGRLAPDRSLPVHSSDRPAFRPSVYQCPSIGSQVDRWIEEPRARRASKEPTNSLSSVICHSGPLQDGGTTQCHRPRSLPCKAPAARLSYGDSYGDSHRKSYEIPAEIPTEPASEHPSELPPFIFRPPPLLLLVWPDPGPKTQPAYSGLPLTDCFQLRDDFGSMPALPLPERQL